MKKVVFRDGTCVFINDDQVEAFTVAIKKGNPFWLTHAGGRDFIRPSFFVRLTGTGGEFQKPEPVAGLLEKPEISDEKRAKNSRFLREIQRHTKAGKRMRTIVLYKDREVKIDVPETYKDLVCSLRWLNMSLPPDEAQFEGDEEQELSFIYVETVTRDEKEYRYFKEQA